MAIYGTTAKPPLGEEPSFATKVRSVPGFSKADSIVIKIAGDIIYEKDDVGRFVRANELIEKALLFEVSKEEIINSLEFLESKDYWKISRTITGIEWSNIIVTDYGFSKYCEVFVDNFTEIFKEIISNIINDGLKSSSEIAAKSKCRLVVANSMLDYFENCGYVGIIRSIGRRDEVIFRVSAEGKRYFENILSE